MSIRENPPALLVQYMTEDATGKGSGLTFVIQNGGAERNFTSGIEDGTYARYTIRDGKIEKVMDLDPSTSMSEGASLADFIGWTKENYSADRYMLVFWDHGGGLTYGYGLDQINYRADGENIMPCAEIVEAVKTSGVKFDLIDYLMRLGDMDYDDAILTDKERQELLDAVRACIVMRNGNSGSGIGGVSFCFPVKAISDYGQTHVQLEAQALR